MNKAYLSIPTGSGVNQFALSFGEDGPTTGIGSIEAGNDGSAAAPLYDLSGRPMCHVVPTAGQHEVTLPTHHLPPGTYTLRVDGESLKCLVR